MFLFPMPIAPHSLPPNPSLAAIVLIVTTRRGPRFVFHYPGTPEPSQPSDSWAFGSLGSDSESSDDSSDDDDQGTTTSDAGDTGSRAGSIGSTNANGGGTSKYGGGGSLSAKTGKWSVTSGNSTRRTARTLREDGPDDEDDVDEDVEALDLASAAETSAANNEVGGGNVEDHHHRPMNGNGDKTRLPEWEKVLGYPTEGLEKLLSPPDKFRKKKFEVSIEDLVFLGYPVFVRKDGTWMKKHKDRKQRRGGHDDSEGQDTQTAGDTHGQAGIKNPFAQGASTTGSGGQNHDDDDDEGDVSDGPDLSVPRETDLDSPALSPTTVRRHDFAKANTTNHLASPEDSTAKMSESPSDAKSISTEGDGSQSGDNMSMFHVVFVMTPPTLEYHIRVQEMYDNVVKKFSKALRFEQAQSGWVEKQVKMILAMKSQAKENKNPPPMPILWAKIIQQSPLAKAIANVYTSIASNKIAHVSIGSSFEASIQIPQAISTSYVATPMEPQLPGLWLTTASMLEGDDGTPELSPHAALLLLEDRETMLKDIESDNKDKDREKTTPLAFFIRELNPTKSLKKLSVSLQKRSTSTEPPPLSLRDMQFLARHLIYWRRARAVPPLHMRDTYIVSPNCDLKQLSRATTLYAQRFSALPSLPNMLQLLSSKPKQYGRHIPSKDHKAAYMDILAWLLRGGWVTQLRTFAWVKITPKVKAAVATQLRKDAEEKTLAKAKEAMNKPDGSGMSKTFAHSSASTASRTARRTYSEDDYVPSASTSRKSSRSKASPRLEGLRSPIFRPRDRSCSDTASTVSGRTVIPFLPPSTFPSPALTAHRPSPLHAVDNINPLSPLDGVVESTSAPEIDSVSAASGPGLDTAETIFSDSNEAFPSTDEADYETSLVLSPHKASSLESKWLAYVGTHLEDVELRAAWGILVKHFNGERAIEEIASREGLKRKRVDELMEKLEAEGVLWVVRHW